MRSRSRSPSEHKIDEGPSVSDTEGPSYVLCGFRLAVTASQARPCARSTRPTDAERSYVALRWPGDQEKARSMSSFCSTVCRLMVPTAVVEEAGRVIGSTSRPSSGTTLR